jgi:hypothetical protein
MGFRRARRGGEELSEYVFHITSGRSVSQSLQVILPESVLREWMAAHGRELTASERFAIAKLSLKHELDECDHPGSLTAEIQPDQAQVERISVILDL